MDTVQVRMTNLFNQLGLDSSPKAIASFITKHAIKPNTPIAAAPFWTPAQRELISELLDEDAEWAIVVDELGTTLTTKPILH